MSMPLSTKQLEKLHKAGFVRQSDFLLRLPVDYNDFAKVIDANKSLPSSGFHCFSCTVLYRATPVKKSPFLIANKPISFSMAVSIGSFKITLHDNRKLSLSGFKDCRIGDTVMIYGEIGRHEGQFILTQGGIVPKYWEGRVKPIYKGVHGVYTPGQMTSSIQDILGNKVSVKLAVDKINEALGDYKIESEQLNTLLYKAHKPSSISEARRVLNQLHEINIQTLLANNSINDRACSESIIDIDDETINEAMKHLPFSLSPSQHETIDLIIEDVRSNKAMNICVSGDVGSGKTIVQLLPAVIVQQSGKRCAIMAPNELLAVQIFNEINKIFPHIPSVYVGGGAKNIDLSNNPILVGTTAIIYLIQKANYPLDLICMDEQQKMGVEQKAALIQKHTNSIELSATLIPKSMGSILFTGQKISRIFPHTEKNISSYICHAEHRQQMFNMIGTTLKAGGKVAIIYPEVEAKKRTALLEAETYWKKHYPDQYTLIYGSMKKKEKREKIESLLAGEKPLILATSILEIGVDIDLQLLIVIGADKLGASTLHQCRGRVARRPVSSGKPMGAFIMYTPSEVSETAKKRMDIVKNNNDGFVIAEKDMMIRGVGDILGGGSKQSGLTHGIFLGNPIQPERLTKYLSK